MSSAPRSETCPLCGDATLAAFRPFCGRGCRDRDLLSWLGEGYRIPGRAADPGRGVGLDKDDETPL